MVSYLFQLEGSENKCGNEFIWFEELHSKIAKFEEANEPNIHVHNSTRNPMPWVNLPSFWDNNHGHPFQGTYLNTTYQLGVGYPKKHIWDYNHRFSEPKQTGQNQIDR